MKKLLILLTHSRRKLIAILLGAGALGVGVATAAIISGASTTNISAHVTYTQLTINKPAVTTGDVMIASIAVLDGSIVGVTPPTGWTQIARTDNDINVTLISYWKAVGTSEPVTYTWTIDEQTKAVGGITPYSGVDAINPIDSVAGNTGFGTIATTTAITASAANEEIVTLFATDVNKTFSTPSGMTQKYSLAHVNAGPLTAAYDVTQVNSGTVASKSTNIAGNKSRNWSSQAIALRLPSQSIAFDAASSNFTSSPGTSISTPHTVSGSNRILFVSVNIGKNCGNCQGDLLTGVTYNGAPLTLVGKVATHSGIINPLETYLYYILAPDIGTHDIVVSYSALGGVLDAVWVASASYTGVSQSGLDASAVSADNIFPATSVTGTVTTVADNDWIVMGSYSGDGSTSAGAGTTIRATSPALDRQVLSDSGGPKHPAGSATLTVNGNSDRVGSIVAAISPAY